MNKLICVYVTILYPFMVILVALNVLAVECRKAVLNWNFSGLLEKELEKNHDEYVELVKSMW